MMSFLSLQFICPLCVRCGSFRVEFSFFCQDCENIFLRNRLQTHYRGLDQHQVQSLIAWHPYESDSLSEVVYLLKSRWSGPAWHYYAKFLDLDLANPRSTVVVPAPGKTELFARAVTALSGYKSLSCIQRSRPKIFQKDRNLAQRADVEFQFVEEFTNELGGYERVILIDDIITSGYTLSACLAALKPHLKRDCKIDIIALFSREKV